ncbi:energy transducer TonB [Algoriphagus winogradskyi]|uniref:TonB family C-terminal domain-containing protein n=1 Tax=Algoriphagus winogradskyi TaxID=237017 RepID=A0ABY1PAL4_9BACT|nr:energy transducer TonB [Algoriphagus winogradskyi]SMP29631.1 TonB family C-terminal domain-containing protein [Algoriphagus winogradskyi]
MAFKNTFRFFLLITAFLGLSSSLYKSQDTQIVRLNKHFYPIAEADTINYFYKGIIVNLSDSTSIERIFNLKNQIVKVTRYGHNQEGDFPEENTETYDENGKLTSKKIKNRNNGFYHAIYYSKGEKIGEVLFQGEKNFEIRKAGSEEVITADENVFEPKPKLNQDLWNQTLMQNLKYPALARRDREEGTAILGMYVNEFGEHGGFELANPENVSESLALEALQAASKYEGEITPATNHDGNTIDAWLYIPVRFKLD